MYEVTMPKLSDSMEEGKIIAWKVQEGDAVSEGQVIAEVESDKAVMELECFQDGVLAEIRHEDGSEVPVGDVIALIRTEEQEAEREEEEPREEPEEKEKEEEAEEAEAPDKREEEEAKKEPEEEPEEEEPKEEKPKEREAEKEKPKKKPKVKREPKPAPEPARPEPERPEPPPTFKAISPYAKKLADDHGLDYRLLKGSGPDGRIVADDVEAAAKILKPGAEAPPRSAPARPDDELPALDLADDEAEVVDMPFRLKTQALRVTHSKHLIPHFYITRGADVTELLRRQSELKEKIGATVTHLVMLACIRALEANPKANWSYDRGRIVKWNGIRFGLAVATDEGLTVGVLPDAADLSLEDLVGRSKDLVARARTGKLSADERKHASFTLTNLGMFGVEHFEPIINPPSSITLAVASALPEPVVRDDAVHAGRVMRLSASCDHRIVDGVIGAQFLADVVERLEDPGRLLDEAPDAE
jgi:pyruvate dehydrogenase E2 component (dihydrolipoamide acetyltransferase)